MNKEEPFREQAERIKQPIEKINEQGNEQFELGEALPPRERRHQKKKKIKWKIKYPVIRLLVLLFILLPVIIFSVISVLDGKKGISKSAKTSADTVGETINIESPKQPVQNKSQSNDQVKWNNSNEEQAPGQKSVAPKPESFQFVPGSQNTEKNSPPQSQGVNNATASQKAAGGNAPSQQSVKNIANTKPKPRVIYHRVQPNENLYKLAVRYYHSANGMEIIIQANHLSSNQLQVGQLLKIPLNN